MSPGVRAAAVRPGDLVELTKPGITFMVVVTAGLGYFLGSAGELDWGLLLATLAGVALVSSGASALNHVAEREVDGRMRRTANRPLPAGRLDPDLALLFALGLATAGLLLLATLVNLLSALLAGAALGGYILVYTPLKRRSSLATVVGAIPGALPPMMGWAAVRGSLDAGAWVLFGILFLWQLPHFLAIAWLCRRDYAAAGMPMLPVLDPDGSRTGRQSVLYAATLLPVSLLPSVLGLAATVYLAGALVLGSLYLGACVAFARSQGKGAARQLMLASVLYLPALLLVLVADRLLAG